MGARKITFHETHSLEQEHCGWDTTSLLGGQLARYIEVKGRAGEGDVALSANKWIKAQRFGKDYWLYIVINYRSNPELHMIQDPASKLSPKEEVSVVRYMVGHHRPREPVLCGLEVVLCRCQGVC